MKKTALFVSALAAAGAAASYLACRHQAGSRYTVQHHSRPTSKRPKPDVTELTDAERKLLDNISASPFVMRAEGTDGIYIATAEQILEWFSERFGISSDILQYRLDRLKAAGALKDVSDEIYQIDTSYLSDDVRSALDHTTPPTSDTVEITDFSI